MSDDPPPATTPAAYLLAGLALWLAVLVQLLAPPPEPAPRQYAALGAPPCAAARTGP